MTVNRALRGYLHGTFMDGPAAISGVRGPITGHMAGRPPLFCHYSYNSTATGAALATSFGSHSLCMLSKLWHAGIEQQRAATASVKHLFHPECFN